MRQDVGRLRSRPARMVSLVQGSAVVLLSLTSRISAGTGDGPGDVPDLAKPNEMPAIVSTPTRPMPSNPPAGRAVLALPGITAPSSPKPGTAPPAVVSSPSIDATPGGLQLDAPLEMKGSSTNLNPLPRVTPVPSNGRPAQPLVLESPDQEPIPIEGSPSNSKPSTKRPSTPPRVDSQVATPTQKRGRLFGLFPTPAPAPTPSTVRPADSSSVGRSPVIGKTTLPGRSIVEGVGGDIAAESALKRRIEKQARELVGDRARSIDVRIVGKVATVQARGVKLFQKRAVRKSLESMPSLSGLKSTIEVID